jgi:hypothetical protein
MIRRCCHPAFDSRYKRWESQSEAELYIISKVGLLAISPVTDSNLVSSVKNHEDDLMAIQRIEKLFASGIYLLMGISAAYTFSVGLANGIYSGHHYSIEQKVLISAALIGAATLFVSAILVHFRSGKAYVIAMVGLQLLLVPFFPLMLPIALEIIIHRTLSFSSYGLSGLFSVVLLAALTIFTPLRLLKQVSS